MKYLVESWGKFCSVHDCHCTVGVSPQSKQRIPVIALERILWDLKKEEQESKGLTLLPSALKEGVTRTSLKP